MKKRRLTVKRLEEAARRQGDGEELSNEEFMMVMLNTCSKCLKAFKDGQKLGQLPMVEGGPIRWHKRCPAERRVGL